MTPDSGEPSSKRPVSSGVKVVVATTVALTFISFWRAGAIVLSDLASTMFYIGGIAEQAIGKTAPWFIIAVLVFSFAVRSVYMESCGMFVRGGVYVVVRDSMGRVMAKLSVAALVVDYALTGPISAVSAGHYLAGLLNEISGMMGQSLAVQPRIFAVLFALAVTVYFWRSNIRGIQESSGHALHIMQITTVMVAILLVWAPVTLLIRGRIELPPLPTTDNIHLPPHSLGWLQGTMWEQVGAASIVIAFAHSLLAMSGFETLAQVYRELAFPKIRNLRRTANLVCSYALLSTGAISLFAVMIIPDDVRRQHWDNLIGGLVMSLAGPELMRLAFHVFVVIVGVLILSGAVNTSIIGANGILNRVAEDGVLLEWFRRPHKRFGTSSRIIHMIVILQAAAILLSRGDVYLLGEAYAFGVVWSFFLKSVGVLALRFRRKDQEYKTPLNLSIAGREIPLGLMAIAGALFLVALANLFTKQVATIAGLSLTSVLFLVFLVSERVAQRKSRAQAKGLEEFNLEHEDQVDTETVQVRPGAVLVAVRDYTRLHHLQKVLEKTNIRRHDIVVMTVRPIVMGTGEHNLREDQLFSDYERELFSRVVAMAEREGKPVSLLTVPATDPFVAMVQSAQRLKASRLVTGVSARMSSEELAHRIGRAWEKLPEPRHAFSLEVIRPGGDSLYVNLGPHPPRLWPEDISRLHQLWLELTGREEIGSRLHHRDVVGVALRRLERDLRGQARQEVIREFLQEMGRAPAQETSAGGDGSSSVADPQRQNRPEGA